MVMVVVVVGVVRLRLFCKLICLSLCKLHLYFCFCLYACVNCVFALFILLYDFILKCMFLLDFCFIRFYLFFVCPLFLNYWFHVARYLDAHDQLNRFDPLTTRSTHSSQSTHATTHLAQSTHILSCYLIFFDFI